MSQERCDFVAFLSIKKSPFPISHGSLESLGEAYSKNNTKKKKKKKKKKKEEEEEEGEEKKTNKEEEQKKKEDDEEQEEEQERTPSPTSFPTAHTQHTRQTTWTRCHSTSTKTCGPKQEGRKTNA